MRLHDCVLLSDDGDASNEAEKVLKEAGIAYSVISTSKPGREGRRAPQLYTRTETIPDLDVIRSWARLRSAKDMNGSG